MKIKINIKSIIFMTILSIASLLFINISFATNTGKIVVETAKLREQPNTDSKILELASLGEEVEILEEVDGWYKVIYKRITGYIRSDLIQEENKEKTNAENIAVINENATTENIVDENKLQENETVETNIQPVEDKITEKGKYKIVENLKLKIIPLISAIELDELNKDVEVEVIEILRNWAKVKTQDGKEGWLRTDKLAQIQEDKPEESNKVLSTDAIEATTNNTQTASSETKTMYVNSQIINVRQKADKTSEVIKKLTVNTEVTVLSTENGWCYVEIDGIKGYISDSLLSSKKQETSRSATTTRNTDNIKTTENNSNNTTSNTNSATDTSTTQTTTSEKGNSVVSYAKQFLGCKYVYGGTSPNGFDCSGFTQYVYKNFGINLNRTAAAQYGNGTSVTSLQPGDLVMFGKSGINHVGIYIGGNTFIHAANKSRGVTTDTLSSGYYKTNYVGARRIF